jgi:hypothetical protein
MKTCIHFRSHLAQFFLEWEMFRTKVVEKIKARILYSVTFSRKTCRLCDNVEKCLRSGQDRDGNMVHAHLKAGYLRLQTDSQNITIAFPTANSGCTNVSRCCHVCSVPSLSCEALLLDESLASFGSRNTSLDEVIPFCIHSVYSLYYTCFDFTVYKMKWIYRNIMFRVIWLDIPVVSL